MKNHTFKIVRNTNHQKDMINVYDENGNKVSHDVGDQYAWRKTYLSSHDLDTEEYRPYYIKVRKRNYWNIYIDGYKRVLIADGQGLEELCKYLNANNFFFRYIEDGED